MSKIAVVFAAGMLLAGSLSTISTKLADFQCVPDFRLAGNPLAQCAQLRYGVCSEGCRTFNHPYVQSIPMFLGELLCMGAFHITLLFQSPTTSNDIMSDKKSSKFQPTIFAIPALCDMLGSGMMNVGLTMTHASVYQMLRGSVVVFTGIFSVVFLGRKLAAFHWIGMVLVLTGAFVVGLSSVIDLPESEAAQPSNPGLGNTLIVAAQLLAAAGAVVEEKMFSSYRLHALQVVGWEGLWGLALTCVSLIVMFYLPFGDDVCYSGVGDARQPRTCLENTYSAGREMGTSPVLAAATAFTIISVAIVNYCGVSVTKSMSATHRMMLDSLRTIAVWAVSLVLGWQALQPLQVLGFAVLLAGTLIYNEIIYLPFRSKQSQPKEPLLETLLDREAVGGS